MSFHTAFFLAGVAAELVIIYFAWLAASQLLLAGSLLHLVVDAQVLLLKVVRLSGGSEPAVPTQLAFFNRFLVVCSLVLVTIGIVQLLRERTQLRKSLPADDQSPSDVTSNQAMQRTAPRSDA